jgi:hypothetical protein
MVSLYATFHEINADLHVFKIKQEMQQTEFFFIYEIQTRLLTNYDQD